MPCRLGCPWGEGRACLQWAGWGWRDWSGVGKLSGQGFASAFWDFL